MEGRGKLQIEHDYHWLQSRSSVPLDRPIGALVEQGDRVYQLPPDRGESGFSPRPQSEFPQASVLAVRRTTLAEFTTKHVPHQARPHKNAGEKPLEQRERSTLLAIIEALCQKLKIDLRERGAATRIAELTQALGATVTDDTTTNAVRYPLFADQTTGSLTTTLVSSTKYNFNPSSGLLTATGFSGSGASLTSLPAGQLSGTIPNAVLGNSSLYIGTTSIALNRASSAQSLTGVNIDGSAGSATTAGTATNANNVAITDDTSTAAEMYLSWVTTSTGNLPIKVSSTKLKFNPSTGVLTATGGVTGGTF